MAGPWEKYQKQAEGPWAKYAKAPVAQPPDGGAAGDVMRSGASGMARGGTSILDLPANLPGLLAQGGSWVGEKVGLIDPATAQKFRSDISEMASHGGATATARKAAPGLMDYKPETTPGEYARTVGEFLPGMALGGKATQMVAAGLGSEFGGQMAEGTEYETAARIGGGLLGSFIKQPKPGAFAGNSESAKMANELLDKGVRNVTAGQATGSQSLKAAEGRLAPTAQQIDDFTASTMRQLGSKKRLATPQNLAAVESRIVSQMDDAVKGVQITPTPRNAMAAADVAKKYAERVPAGQLTPRMRGIADEIRKLAVSRTPAPLSQLKEWRSDVGKLTVSTDAATRDAAHALRGLIDQMTDAALTNAGRADDIAKLASARESYRNYIAVRDAASRAGAEGGTLSPQQLNQSMIRAQGREAYATGRTTPMAEFTRSGASVLRPASTVQPGGIRSIAGAVPAASAAIMGGGALTAGMGPLVAGGIAAGAAFAPEIGKAMMRSNLAQGLLRDPRRALTQPLSALPGLLPPIR